MGGVSAERDISLKSGAAVLAGLKRSGIDAHAVDAKDHVLQQLEQGGFDRVFLILHGRGGEDGVIQGALQSIGMPYTGSGVMACALSMDKMRTKHLWRSMALPSVEWACVNTLETLTEAVTQLGCPVMVKPNREGSSIGMTKVENASQISDAWERACDLDGDLLVEKWISGKEYTATVLAGEVLPLIRLETPRGFYDYEAKYVNDDTRYHCPCGLSAEDEKRCQDVALQAFSAVGASGWGRVDFFLDDTGNLQLLEVNLIPGMTDHSLVPMSAAAVGITFEELVVKILDTSFEVRL